MNMVVHSVLGYRPFAFFAIVLLLIVMCLVPMFVNMVIHSMLGRRPFAFFAYCTVAYCYPSALFAYCSVTSVND